MCDIMQRTDEAGVRNCRYPAIRQEWRSAARFLTYSPSKRCMFCTEASQRRQNSTWNHLFLFFFPPHSDSNSDSWKPAWGRPHEPACKPKLRFTLVNKSETSVCPRRTVCSWRRGPRRGEGAGAAARERERKSRAAQGRLLTEGAAWRSFRTSKQAATVTGKRGSIYYWEYYNYFYRAYSTGGRSCKVGARLYFAFQVGGKKSPKR